MLRGKKRKSTSFNSFLPGFYILVEEFYLVKVYEIFWG